MSDAAPVPQPPQESQPQDNLPEPFDAATQAVRDHAARHGITNAAAAQRLRKAELRLQERQAQQLAVSRETKRKDKPSPPKKRP